MSHHMWLQLGERTGVAMVASVYLLQPLSNRSWLLGRVLRHGAHEAHWHCTLNQPVGLLKWSTSSELHGWLTGAKIKERMCWALSYKLSSS
eukprot:638402-Amphidinium_carterae.1